VVKFRQGCRSLQLSRFFAIGLRVAPSFAEVRSWFCKAWHSFTIPHVLRLTRQVSGHDFALSPTQAQRARAAKSCRKGTTKRNFPYAVGPGVPDTRGFRVVGWDSRADAPGEHGVPDTRGFRVVGWRFARSCSRRARGPQHARFSRVGIGARFLARRDAMQRSARKNSMPWCGTRPYKKPPTVGAMGNASKAVVGICRGNGKFARCHAKHYGRGCPSLFNPGHLQLRL
jgi:hypothetical protein